MATPSSFGLTTEDVGDDVQIVSLSGEADRFRTDAVGEAIDAARASGRTPIVDMSAVIYLDSSMIAALVAAGERGRRRDGALVVLCTAARLRRSLELKGLETILHLAESREQALELAS